MLDVSITMQGGVGTNTVTQPATGNCDGGTVIASGVVVDSDFFDPVRTAPTVGSTRPTGQPAARGMPPIPTTWGIDATQPRQPVDHPPTTARRPPAR